MKTIRYAACDLNGQLRGKRTLASDVNKLSEGTARLPLSVLNLDLWGEDIEDSPLLFDTGDADGILRPTGRGPVPMPWLTNPSELHPMWVFLEDGTPFEGDPRHALDRVLSKFRDKGLSVLAATELEFYLCDGAELLRPPKNPLTGSPLKRSEITGLQTLDAFDAFFTDLYDACAAMEIPAQTTISEGGIGQFEVNLTHQDAMKAADDTWLFKHMVKGLARKHGMAATFMAKPYDEDAGSGLHVHFSVMGEAGHNIFDDCTARGALALHHAVAGCLKAMTPSTLIFAPHLNSYARLQPGSHAPTAICWGYENRSTALRIPGGPPAARRIEHRVPGGDINPYLMLTAILGAAINGIEAEHMPSPPITGNAYNQNLPQLAGDWQTAIDLFSTSSEIAGIFPATLIENLTRTKRQELAKFAALSETDALGLALERV
ncbi:glutamine synthetase family protein [Litoreibacter roseus]|uniref:Glutamine synthetase n=1 Tax=Litoreibacter roseus TaxID=2601869 RepID=A0A6N6JIH4_9RHOB|nr:glutamine synthetase family protein [Litoreibacter roseus]GFE65914.1 glutamine synthetase [Litoreibacter roseus]